MAIKTLKLEDPSLAQEMSDLNHAAFGYRQIRDLSRYCIQQRMKGQRYEACGVIINGKLEGFLFIDHSPEEFMVYPEEKCIENFSVWPWSQGKGVGSMLLDYVLNSLYKESPFHLTVSKSNKAVYLYKKFGFVKIGAPEHIRSNAYVAMIKVGRRNGRYRSKADSETLAKAC